MRKKKLSKEVELAILALAKYLKWNSTATKYLVAYIYFLSGGSPSACVTYNHAKLYVGYLLIHSKRMRKAGVQTALQLFRMKPAEQILWHNKVLKPECRTLLDVSRTVLGLPNSAKEDYVVYNTVLQYLPQYKTRMDITLGEVMQSIQDIADGKVD